MAASLLLYKKITPLNRERHRDLKLQLGSGKAHFAQNVHYVPLAATEFYQASRSYPILFAGSSTPPAPVALLGLRENENLFVDKDGEWDRGDYVPAFVRRYPFVLGNANGDDKEFTVCIDEDFAGFSREKGTALFSDDGKDSSYLVNTIDFLNHFQAEMKRTRQFVEALVDLDLLQPKNLKVSDNRGRQFVLKDFRIVDEARLNDLSAKKLAELHKSQFLGLIYAHLISIGNATRFPAKLNNGEPIGMPEAEVVMEQVSSAAAGEEDSIH